MKCPYRSFDKTMPETFSKWDKACQKCEHYDCCIDKEEDTEGQKKEEALGDNYPILPLYTVFHNERQDMVKKLLQEELKKITKDDIVDFIIDIEVYNAKC